MKKLTTELNGQFGKEARLNQAIKKSLKMLSFFGAGQ
jgi:hypothetical protein